MVISTELQRALKAKVRSLVEDLEAAHQPVNPRDVAQRALIAQGPIGSLPPDARIAIVVELTKFVRELRREGHARIGGYRQRLEQLRRTLEATCADPSSTNLHAVDDALQGIEFGNDDDSTDEEDHLELHCDELGRALAQQLGPSAPPWLHRFTLADLDAPTNGDEGPSTNEIVYECPVCGDQVRSAPGLRARCSNGHAPAFLVATRPDED
jgi:hypothetical protein